MSLLVSPDALLARRQLIGRGGDLAALDQHLAADLARVLARPLYVPDEKALLSRWGAHCRDDEAELAFDPFSPETQRCTKCGHAWSTEQTRRWWIYWYQLWLAERVLMMALRSGPGGDPAAEARALETLAAIVERYQRWPNADNVLGPSRPFFSTYLESIWILHLAAAAATLDGLGRLPRGLNDDLRRRLFAPSAALIADFDEGRSNRQVWNAAALYALGRLLGDQGLAERAANGPSGIVATMTSGLLADGLWYEGENYHWFALRGMTWGAELLREAGGPSLWDHGRFLAAFRAPVLTALPDFSFPARRDSKFGVSLRQRRIAELWELALGEAGKGEGGKGKGKDYYSSLLAHVYDPAIPEGEDTAWREITEVDRAEAPRGLRRGQLGWKAWLWMEPELPDAPADAWRPGTEHLESTGLAIFRRDEGQTYVSLDYGEPGGGHGHPDRLNLTAVLRGEPWLLDFGTGSYVAPSLAWYRATLAHNAPLVDGVSQHTARGHCVAFDDKGGHGWVCATLPGETAYDGAALQRTVVVTPGYVLDVVQLMSEAGDRRLMVPWHGLGVMTNQEEGISFQRPGGALRVLLSARQPFQVLVQRGAGPPAMSGQAEELAYAVTIAAGEAVTLAACLDSSGAVAELECVEDDYVVRMADGTVHLHRATDDGWEIELEQGDPIALGGLREDPELAPTVALGDSRGILPGIAGSSPSLGLAEERSPPAHPIAQPLVLNRADQYRRAEESYPGPAAFSAQARLELEHDTLRVAVDVAVPGPRFRPAGAPDPEWENENPDIHSDGIQVYVEDGGLYGWLIVPDDENQDQLRVSAVRGTDADRAMISNGVWQETARGYRVSFTIQLPDAPSGDFGFDLLVNRLDEGHERRSGQLVWSGALEQRLYLAGDRAVTVPLPRIAL